MLQRQGRWLLSSLPPVVLFLSACGAPKNPPPPKWTIENPRASIGAPPAAQATSQTARASRETTADRSAPSSLEALRRGESTATPSSGPLKDVYFDFDRYALKEDARETLRGNAEWLKTNPAARVQIEGHCDERGTAEYNLALGAKRAQAAKDYLETLGIAAARLSTVSYGEEVPVCKERTEACWQKNRRARFVILQARPGS